MKILNFWEIFEIQKFFEILTKKSGFLDSDDNARGSRITITVVCPISDVQLKIPRKLFKLPVNSSAAVNSLENYGPVNSLSVNNVKQQHFYFFKKALRKYTLRYNKPVYYTLRFYFPYLSLLAQPVTIFVYGPVTILVYGPAMYLHYYFR